MKNTGIKRKPEQPVITVKVVYKNGGTGLKDAYRLLAKKLLEEKGKCVQQSMSE